MPSLKPFLYYVDFLRDPDDQQERLQNIDSIRGMIKGYNIEMSKYAEAAIIAASYVVSWVNPYAVTTNWHYVIVGEDIVWVNSYGLWQTDTRLEDEERGESYCVSLFDTLATGNGYSARDDAHTTISQFLRSEDNDNLCAIFIKNYTMYGYPIPTRYFNSSEWLQYCKDVYNYILQIIETRPVKISPAAAALFAKKKRKRWWK